MLGTVPSQSQIHSFLFQRPKAHELVQIGGLEESFIYYYDYE